MKSDLDIFKKHLGEIQGVNEFKAIKFALKSMMQMIL